MKADTNLNFASQWPAFSDMLRCGLWLREEQFSISNSALIYKDDQSKSNNFGHKYYI